MFYRQHYHLVALAVLILLMFIASFQPGMMEGQLWGLKTLSWFMITIGVVILHQLYVWACWRSELHFRTLTEHLGRTAFPVYGFFAVLFLIGRPTFVLLTAISNQQSIPIPDWMAWTLSVLFGLLFVMTVITLVRHFSLTRILGGDHFYRDIREAGLVKSGLFQYIPHPMYSVGMLGMWIPGIIFRSQAALLLALFQHLYIWVHYYTLEQPDMEQLYTEHAEPWKPDS